MKKYVKPELFFENYELSQHIAACAWDLNVINNSSVCGFKGDSSYGLEGYVVMMESTVCTAIYDESTYCYHTSSPEMTLFNS